MSDGTLFTGKSVEDAVADGLRSLGLTEQQVEIVVLNRGSRGLFGLGSEPAQVRIVPRSQGASAPVVANPVTPAPVPASQPAASVAAAEELEPPVAEPVQPKTTVPQASAVVEPQEAEPDASEPAVDGDDAELVELAIDLLSETVRLMGFEANVVAGWRAPDADNDDPYLLLNLEGRDLGALIGRRGETLNNLQYLLRLMVNQRTHAWKNIVVDVEHYREHRVEHLTQLALRSAQQVAKSGRALALEPMPPNERRIIHLALRDNPDVYTESSGEGERRKIHILPKRA